jgi:hypothetical protein
MSLRVPPRPRPRRGAAGAGDSRRWARLACAACALVALVGAAGCRNVLTREYEYEEDVYLALDGSATVYVNASVPALVALRRAPLPLDPKARLDRNDIRAFYQGPVTTVRSVTTSRREGRRYVHVRLDVADVRRLGDAPPFAWSRYGFTEKDGVFVYTQQLSEAAGAEVGDVGWDGNERVAVRLHLPSRVPFHNAPSRTIERGNILVWEQPLQARRSGEPLAIEAHMETASILARTLSLFGLMIVLAVAAFALFIWWVMRRGRDDDPTARRGRAGPAAA